MNKYKMLTLLFLLVSHGVESKELTEAEQNQLNEELITAAQGLGFRTSPAKATKIKTMLQNGADVNARDHQGRTALMLVFLSPKQSSSIGRILQVLFENGADVDAKDNEGMTALMFAVTEQPIYVVEKFFNYFEPDIHAQNKKGQTALIIAEWNSNYEVVALFTERELLKQTELKNQLITASQNGDIETLTKLFEKGAYVNATDKNGRTALHWASYSKNLDSVNALLDKGAYIDAKDQDGKTALHWAAYVGYLDIVTTLVDNGADINARDNQGQTAFNLAYDNEHIGVMVTFSNIDPIAYEVDFDEVYD